MRQHTGRITAILAAASFLTLSLTTPGERARAAQSPGDESPNDLAIVAGKSAVVTSAEPIERISVGFGEVAEASAASPTEVVVNAKTPGSTSMILWQRGGGKLFFNINVLPNRFLSDARLESVRREINAELQNQQITVTTEGDVVYLRGTAKDLTSVDRALSMASTLGKVVNLLYVQVPAAETQILLRVRFASIDRTAIKQLGINAFSTGQGNTVGSLGTEQFSPPQLAQTGTAGSVGPFLFNDLLNIFVFQRGANLGATIKALEEKGIADVLSEPNILTENGKQGSFLAGGEFPFPVVQGGGVGTVPTVTIQFREFGVRLNVIPTITPRDTIHLQVAPEVSSLDYTNGLTISGFNIPGLVVRKMRTDVELEDGQSFAIGGLLDKRTTETLQKIPFLGDIPVLGRFFQSKNSNKTNTELLVIVTPEIVRPIPAGAPPMVLPFPKPFLDSSPETAVRNPGTAATGPAPAPSDKTIPVEKMIQMMQPQQPLDVSGSAGGKTNSVGPQPLAPAIAPPIIQSTPATPAASPAQ